MTRFAFAGPDCPVPGCDNVQPSGKVMCRTCWARVPKHLQREVYAAWRALLNGSTAHEDPVGRHRSAKAAAIEAAT